MNEPATSIATKIIELAQDKPAAVAGSGGVAGLGSALLVWADHATRFFQLFAVFFGFLGALIAVILVSPKVWRFAMRWRKYGFIKADKEDLPS